MILTAENYYSQEANLAYMSASQFKAFDRCEAAALAELGGSISPRPPRPCWWAAMWMPGSLVSCPCFRGSTRRSSSGTAP